MEPLTTIVSALISALISAAVTLWMRERDRTRPLWKYSIHKAVTRDTILIAITNIGNGTVYDAHIPDSETTTKLDQDNVYCGSQTSHVIAPGETLIGTITIKETRQRWKINRQPVLDVRVSYRTPPKLKKQHVKLVTNMTGEPIEHHLQRLEQKKQSEAERKAQLNLCRVPTPD